MEALAEPGKAYLTESTAELAHGFMELEDLGQFEIKGASQPVGVFELAGVGAARSRLDLSRERGFSRFVGRDEEMAVLEEALERAERGEGAAVGIVAEPGVGKSRLCHEFAERCRERGIEVFECQAQAHGRAIPFMPVLQMLRSYFGIADGDPERIVREKIAGRSAAARPRLRRGPAAALRLPRRARPRPAAAAAQRRGAPPGAARRRLPPGAGAQPAQLDRRPGRGPALDGRGQRHPARRADRLGRGHARRWRSSTSGPNTTPELGRRQRPTAASRWSRSGPSDTRELLRDLAGEDPSLDGLGELIHERTAGNPFFIEEIVRGLAEAGNLEGERGAYRLARPVEDAGVPASVQTVLAARIDRLGPSAKQLLQAASVTSKEVSERALGMVSGHERERGLPGGALRADRRRLPLRDRGLPGTGLRLPPPADPRGRLRHASSPSSARRPTRRRRER